MVLGLAAALVVFGTFQIQKMPVDVFPEFDQPTVQIHTEALGLSAKEVEGLVTLNLEELLSGVKLFESFMCAAAGQLFAPSLPVGLAEPALRGAHDPADHRLFVERLPQCGDIHRGTATAAQRRQECGTEPDRRRKATTSLMTIGWHAHHVMTDDLSATGRGKK